ncbi:hypothetical protein ACWF94_12465 [Streptomyces sp. NPDC055078]
MWKNARGYGAGSRQSKRDYAPGSWVSWSTPYGKRRTGIVTADPFAVAAAKSAAQVGGANESRTRAAVVPSDGGDAVPLCLPNSNNPEALIKDDGRWRHAAPAHRHPRREEATAA